jgi:hypothetical protein
MKKYDSPVAMPTVHVQMEEEDEAFNAMYGKPEHWSQAEWDLFSALNAQTFDDNIEIAIERWLDEIEERRTS